MCHKKNIAGKSNWDQEIRERLWKSKNLRWNVDDMLGTNMGKSRGESILGRMKHCGEFLLQNYMITDVTNVSTRLSVRVDGAGEVGKSQGMQGIVHNGKEFGTLLLAMRRHGGGKVKGWQEEIYVL